MSRMFASASKLRRVHEAIFLCRGDALAAQPRPAAIAKSPSLSRFLCSFHLCPPSALCRGDPPTSAGRHRSFLRHCDDICFFALCPQFRPACSLGSRNSGPPSDGHPAPRCGAFPVRRSESGQRCTYRLHFLAQPIMLFP